MQPLKVKITSLILIIIITFSVAYNMLSCGYEVLAAGNTVEITSYNSVFRMILPSSAISDEITENSMPLSEWQNVINKYETDYYNSKVMMSGTDDRQIVIEYVDSELVGTNGIMTTSRNNKKIYFGKLRTKWINKN